MRLAPGSEGSSLTPSGGRRLFPHCGASWLRTPTCLQKGSPQPYGNQGAAREAARLAPLGLAVLRVMLILCVGQGSRLDRIIWHCCLAPGAGCGREQGKVSPLLCLGRSEASPNADFCVPDRFPQIIQLASELEFNLGSEPVVSCVATGNPLPTSDSVELRKPDGTVLKVPPLCPCPTTSPLLPAPSKAPVSLLGCWAASGWCGEPEG